MNNKSHIQCTSSDQWTSAYDRRLSDRHYSFFPPAHPEMTTCWTVHAHMWNEGQGEYYLHVKKLATTLLIIKICEWVVHETYIKVRPQWIINFRLTVTDKQFSCTNKSMVSRWVRPLVQCWQTSTCTWVLFLHQYLLNVVLAWAQLEEVDGVTVLTSCLAPEVHATLITRFHTYPSYITCWVSLMKMIVPSKRPFRYIQGFSRVCQMGKSTH